MDKVVPTKAQKLRIEADEIATKVAQIHDEVESKQEGNATAEQIEQVKAWNRQIEELEKQLADTEEWNRSKAEHEARQAKPIFPAGSAQAKTLGEYVLTDAEFKAWRDSMLVGDTLKSHQFGASPSVMVSGLNVKTLITGLSSTSAGAFIVNDRTEIVDQGTSYRSLTLFDVISQGTTDSDTVEFVREGSHTNAAAPILEATATGDGTGASPESAMAFTVVQSPVQSVTHWLPTTRRALADSGQLRSIMDNFLGYGIREEMEDQMANGSGTTPNFTGVLNYSGTTAQAFDTDLPTTYLKARTKVRTTGRATPTAFVLNPTDWQNLSLLKDNEARYYYGGPSATGTPRLWGIPVVESEAMTAGTAMVADWRLAMLWDRQQTSITVSDSHSDFFTRRMVAILAEMRAAFDVLRPAAFVEIALS